MRVIDKLFLFVAASDVKSDAYVLLFIKILLKVIGYCLSQIKGFPNIFWDKKMMIGLIISNKVNFAP